MPSHYDRFAHVYTAIAANDPVCKNVALFPGISKGLGMRLVKMIWQVHNYN